MNDIKEKAKDELKNKINIALKDPILQQGFENICKENTELKEALKGKRCNCMTYLNFKDLEKENAELKRENRRIKTCSNCDEYVIGRCCNYPNGVCHHWKLSEKYKNDDQLDKAMELLKWFVWYFREGSPNLVPYKHKVAEVEQFIKSNEAEK